MNRIVIEVDEQVAKAFMSTDRKKQKNISTVINAWLKKVVNTSSIKQYKQFLNGISDEAIKNGLTSEKLERLLKE